MNQENSAPTGKSAYRETDVFQAELRSIRRRRRKVAESLNLPNPDKDFIPSWDKKKRPPSPGGNDGSANSETEGCRSATDVEETSSSRESDATAGTPDFKGTSSTNRDASAATSQTKADRKIDTVGLALSGGGIRSASFCIGLLQAIGESGLIRFVDYLSAVSGGGYAAGLLAGNANTRGCETAKVDVESLKRVLCPFEKASRTEVVQGDKTEGQQPALVRRLIYRGDYLFRDKFTAAAMYCTGFVMNNLFIFCTLLNRTNFQA